MTLHTLARKTSGGRRLFSIEYHNVNSFEEGGISYGKVSLKCVEYHIDIVQVSLQFFKFPMYT